ncbi:SusC/RagA family TonB-linked outer membrane protein, partial [Proteiniphilum sp. UBA5259]|uniref:SusC/RagA family TonB-linked outer membrane protein n=1 Tax=Proteiniphilum sp. UBA5259 TaxID=1947269 RepID=UPI002579C420
MKKKRLKQKFPIRELKKLFCIMKLVFFFLLLSTNLIWAVQTYAQITSLNLDLNNVALEEVFNAIRKQSEFEFFYNNDQINTTVKVSVKAKEADIEEVLEQVLPAIYEYKIKDRYILINKRKEVTPGLSPQPQQIKKTIIGVITDQKGESIIGANIVEVGTTNGTVTDINGNFALRVEPDATIHISYIGYLSQDIYTSGRNTFKIVLEEDTKALEEVVVVGYGTQNKVTITGSISTISTAELTQSPVSNISNALAGRLPGLLSVQRSGQPGADQSTIRIRGVSSFSGTQDPLVIVDGIEGVNYNVIDPNEIESVSILKDASATAVYGVRGANGVMIITTKRGQSGAPKVSYSYEYAVQEFSDVRHSMNAMDYATHYNLAQSYDGYITGAYNPHFSNEAIEKFRTHEDPVFYPDVDWFAYMFDKTSGQQRHNFNINGGTDKIKYFVSLGY